MADRPSPPQEGPRPPVKSEPEIRAETRELVKGAKHPTFAWPLRNPVVGQFYGWRTSKRMHEGIDLRAGVGTKVYAAASGEVLYRGTKLKGYGRMIVLEHGDGWSTAYAHLSRYAVRLGQKVKRGQLIGYAGRSGRAKGAHLHFELRKGADPLDPLLFLWPRFDLHVTEGEELDPEL
jgi:murein DD-endopeptidase MepM/ murein hydrolase activator NlpD